MTNSLLVVCSVAFGLLLAEITLRLWVLGGFSASTAHSTMALWQPDKKLGWRLRPQLDVWLKTVDYATHFRTNTHGFNDIEHPAEAAQGVRRIVVLGDSFMEAYQVERSASFVRQLSDRLNNTVEGSGEVEVINLGVGGYGTTQEYLMLMEEGVKYAPDLVLLAWLPLNDIRNNSKALESILWGGTDIAKVRARPFASLSSTGGLVIEPPDVSFMSEWLERYHRKQNKNWFSSLKENLLLWYYTERFLDRLNKRTYPKYNPNVWLGGYIEEFDETLSPLHISNDDYEEMWSEAESVSWRILHEIEAYSKEIGARFCAFSVPTRFQVEQVYRDGLSELFPGLKFVPMKLNKKFKAFSEQRDICFIDMVPAFIAEYERTGTPLHYQYDDRHWNDAGHRLAADVIADSIELEYEGMAR